jgi:hypothetical protein
MAPEESWLHAKGAVFDEELWLPILIQFCYTMVTALENPLR